MPSYLLFEDRHSEFWIALATMKTRNIGVRMPVGMVDEIERIMEKEQTYLSVQEFVRLAAKEKIEKWKKEHEG